MRGEGGPGSRLLDLVAPRQRTCLGLSGQCGVQGPGRAGRAGVSGEEPGQRAWSRALDYHARPSLGVRARPCAWVLGGAQGGGGAHRRLHPAGSRSAPRPPRPPPWPWRGPCAQQALRRPHPWPLLEPAADPDTNTRNPVLPNFPGSLAAWPANCLCPVSRPRLHPRGRGRPRLLARPGRDPRFLFPLGQK